MRIRDAEKAERLGGVLTDFSNNNVALPGIQAHENQLALVEQLVESIRRVQYIKLIREQKHDPRRVDPKSDLFDPLKAAALKRKQGDIDEACWLVFLSVHFGKHRSDGWQLTRDVYGALDSDEVWSWERVSRNPNAIAKWLAVNYKTLRSPGVFRRFGNHRKYETLNPSSSICTGHVITSYIYWILRFGTHAELFAYANETSKFDTRTAFRTLYNTMQVLRFGRTAKFDYLTMLAKLGLASIEADSPYLIGATGPLQGAKLLFGGSINAKNYTTNELDGLVVLLGDRLQVGMQEMEDALCNWQKSPGRFARFRG